MIEDFTLFLRLGLGIPCLAVSNQTWIPISVRSLLGITLEEGTPLEEKAFYDLFDSALDVLARKKVQFKISPSFEDIRAVIEPLLRDFLSFRFSYTDFARSSEYVQKSSLWPRKVYAPGFGWGARNIEGIPVSISCQSRSARSILRLHTLSTGLILASPLPQLKVVSFLEGTFSRPMEKI
jgi:hypothetical protein